MSAPQADVPGLPRLLRPEAVADVLGISRPALYAMAGRGELPGLIRIGKRLRFDAAAIREWLEALRAEARQARPPVPRPRSLVLASASARRAPSWEDPR